MRLGQGVKEAGVPGTGGAGPAPGHDRSASQGEVLVGDNQLRVDLQLEAQARAGWTGAVGAVEGEGARLYLAQADAAVDAREAFGEEQLCTVDHRDLNDAAAQIDGLLDGVGEPVDVCIGVHHQTVNHDLYGVPLLSIKDNVFREVPYLAVNTHPDVAGVAGLLKDVLVLPLAMDNQRSHDHDAAVLGQVHDGVHYLLNGLPLHRSAALVAVGSARAGVEEAQVVVNLSDGAHGGARVVRDALLVDGYSGGEALDVLHVRLLHAAQELARVGGEGLHVAALPLGVYGVEGQGAFA